MPSKASNVRRLEGKESRNQIEGIHIVYGTVWKSSAGRGLSVHSNLIVLKYA